MQCIPLSQRGVADHSDHRQRYRRLADMVVRCGAFPHLSPGSGSQASSSRCKAKSLRTVKSLRMHCPHPRVVVLITRVAAREKELEQFAESFRQTSVGAMLGMQVRVHFNGSRAKDVKRGPPPLICVFFHSATARSRRGHTDKRHRSTVPCAFIGELFGLRSNRLRGIRPRDALFALRPQLHPRGTRRAAGAQERV